MYLKRLELLGFKSFPDKTIIKFTPGVTSIVGPNGCGKTNILDSIRWVLGEQRVSLLRGTKMEEIIFNGTHEIKPLGMAEVTLVIQNNKGVLPTEYSEVQITRRLFRSGESEYLLNKVPCRLKDISDLLMDTGVGSHIYSVIQQDMIEAILSDKADERRFLFEEAAGISKYKNRKKAALRKLEATEGDLLRLKDIVAEVNTQVNSLKRQMNKAQRYKNLSEELKGWEIFLGKSAVNELQVEKRRMLTERDNLSDAKVKLDTEINSLSAHQEEERKRLTDIDKELSDISGRIYEKSEAAHNIETDITVLRERRDNSRQLIEKNHLDIEAYKKRREILLEQIDRIENELKNLNEELNRVDEERKQAEQNLAESDDKILSARREREDLGRQLMNLESRLSAGKSNDSNIKEQKSEIDTNLAAFEQQASELRQKKEELTAKKSAIENSIGELRSRLEQSQGRGENIENEIKTLDEQLDDTSGEIYDLSASLEAAEARNHLLKEMVTHYEGFSSGVVAVMEDKDRWPGLMGTVADSLIPKEGYEEAIEAALGEVAGFMLCRDRSTAERIIDYLKNESKGKAGLLITGMADMNPEITRPYLGGDAFIGWADQYVTVPDELKPLAGLLLSRVAIIKSGDHNGIADQLPPFFAAVTTDGRRFDGKVMISGGAREGLSLLGRREKIEEQGQIINDIKSKLDLAKESKNRTASSLGAKQAELRSLVNELDNLREELETAEKELTGCQYELQSLNNDLARTEKQSSDLRAKLEVLNNRQYSLTLNYDQLAKQKDDLVKSLNEHDARTGELEDASQKAESEFSNLQIKQIELKSKKEQLQSQIKHTRELIYEIDTNSNTKSEEIIRAEEEIRGSADKIAELEMKLKETFDARAEISEEQTRIREQHSEVQDELDSREKEIKTLRQLREESSNKLHEIEIRLAEIDSEMRNISTKMKEEYDVDVEEATVQPPSPDVPPEERAHRMQELKERLRDFGAVNLLALEEYDASRERQEFLTTQMEDLLNAKSTLQSTISKINQTARKLFLETFDKVRDNFKQVFEELFTGGEADIRMVNEDDPLESPIEIIARPRGKKLLSIAQMSGGERALTAISLLFAIYLAKPSPFCILDEIDAPLDDANIHRFLRIIKTFSEQTQFIIITHNKITMEAADILYGITMEHPGVSKVVSVRFNEDEDSEDLIDTTIGDGMREVKNDLPEAIINRITPQVNIKPVDNPDGE